MTRLYILFILSFGLVLPGFSANARDCGGTRKASVAKTGKEKGFHADQIDMEELERLIKDMETAPPADRERIEELVRKILNLEQVKDVPDGFFEYNGRRYRLRC